MGSVQVHADVPFARPACSAAPSKVCSTPPGQSQGQRGTACPEKIDVSLVDEVATITPNPFGFCLLSPFCICFPSVKILNEANFVTKACGHSFSE